MEILTTCQSLSIDTGRPAISTVRKKPDRAGRFVFPYVEALPPDQAALLWQATRAFETADADGDIIFQGKCSPATATAGHLLTGRS